MGVLTALEPATSTAVPGAAAVRHTLRVRNGSDQVEEYWLSVLGPLAPWAQVAPERLRIYPGDEATATLTITVPRGPGPEAGPAPLGVRIVPRMHAELADVAEGTVTVAPFGELAAELQPLTVRGRFSARPGIVVENRGNIPLFVRLAGRDDEAGLRFADPDEPIGVPAGTAGRLWLPVRARGLRFTGEPDRYPYVVTVEPDAASVTAGAQAAELRGTYLRLGLFPRWLLQSLLVGGLVAVLVAALMSLPGMLRQQLLAQPTPLVAGAPRPGAAPPPAVPPPPVPPNGQSTGQSQHQQQQQPPQFPPPPPVRPTTAPPTTTSPTMTSPSAAPAAAPPAVPAPAPPKAGQSPSATTTTTTPAKPSTPPVAAGPRTTVIGHGTVGLTVLGVPDADPIQVVLPQDTAPAPTRSWIVNPLDDGRYTLSPAAAAGHLVDQPGGTADSPIALTPAGGNGLSPAQTWWLLDTGTGVAIVNAATGSCLTDAGELRGAVAAACRSDLMDAQTWTLSP